MDHLINTEDSYAERRQLFKNIWEAAMNIDDKDNDIVNKPKVIKTLRLDDEEDRLEVNNKKKKLKLKNLRDVCNKILDFCDRQEADDTFYEKMNVEGYVRKHLSPDFKIKKGKTVRSKKKTKKSKSLISPPRSPADAEVVSDGQDDLNATLTNETPKNTPLKIKQTAKGAPTHKAITKRASATNPPKKKASIRKAVKKGTKTKKQSLSQVSQPPGTILRAEIVRKS